MSKPVTVNSNSPLCLHCKGALCDTGTPHRFCWRICAAAWARREGCRLAETKDAAEWAESRTSKWTWNNFRKGWDKP